MVLQSRMKKDVKDTSNKYLSKFAKSRRVLKSTDESKLMSDDIICVANEKLPNCYSLLSSEETESAIGNEHTSIGSWQQK